MTQQNQGPQARRPRHGGWWSRSRRRRFSRLLLEWPCPAAGAGRRSVCGGAAAVVAISVAVLTETLLPQGTSPVAAVGEGVVNLVPNGLRELAIATLGTNDKGVLVGIIVVIAVLICVVSAAAGRSRRPLVGSLLGLAGLEVVATAVAAPASRLSGFLGAFLAFISGMAVVVALGRADGDRGVRDDPPEPEISVLRAYSRRQFVVASSALVAAALVMDAVAGYVSHTVRASADAARAAIRLPRVARPLPPVPGSASFDLPGLSSLITANRDFYRIDTALDVPQVDPATWKLSITGMVKSPITITYAELLAMPQVEADITLCCVSDKVGDNLISSARWQGVRLADLLDRAQVRNGANQIVGRSVDGFTAGFPTSAVFDGRDALVAVGMNGVPLPIEHGFPARLVVPGLYGYVSATKWLTEIQLTTFAAVTPFWIDRGWSLPAPIYTESRIDVPSDGAQVVVGDVVIAGVAWAQHRGIGGVEVRVDGGPWLHARMADALGIDTWRQWRIAAHVGGGGHTIEVRATDATGAVQTEQKADPFPSGATGYHTIRVSAE